MPLAIRKDSQQVDSPAYSIIIVNYNGGQHVIRCVESVFNFTDNFELFLVDNGSIDGSERRVLQQFPTVKLVKNLSNIGFARANNIAMRMASGSWFILLNPDTIATSAWLDKLIECANSVERAGIVTPKLMRPDGKTIDSTGHLYNFATGYSSVRGSEETDRGQFDSIEEIPSCCFACAAIRKKVVDQTGLLDDKMILYFEDIDYCLRARLAGWKIVYCPRSTVIHVRGGLTTRQMGPLQRKAIAYRLRIILKCYNTRNAVVYGALRVARDMISALAGLKNNNPEYFISYLRSPIWNALNFPIAERRFVQLRRLVTDEDLHVRLDRF